MTKFYKDKKGFTLVELSIVIVIISLLVGGTLTAISLVASTETKTILAEVQKLQQAITQFQGVYKGLPGDIANATSYWPATTNGNNDGQVSPETSNEPFAALQQLYLASLLEGSYTGFTGTWGTGFSLATPIGSGNVIGLKGRTGAGLYFKCCSGTDYTRNIVFNNHISVFSIYPTDATKRAGILTPTEAYDIDVKVDDGLPDGGFVSGSAGWSGTAYGNVGCYTIYGWGGVKGYDTDVAANKNVKNCQMQFAYDWN